MKIRADKLLVKNNIVENLDIASRYIMSGVVFVDNLRIYTPGEILNEDSIIYIKEDLDNKYASRGGLKLEKAFKLFKSKVSDKVCMDIGSSNGGFTDCLLAFKASKVYSVDVGYGLLEYRLRIDPRVFVMERTNIRNIKSNQVNDKIDFFTIDLSFISLKKVLFKTLELGANNFTIISLIKPQFELEKADVEEGGIIKDPKLHIKAIEKVYNSCLDLDLTPTNLTYSPIKGAKGNIEFLMEIKRDEIFYMENKLEKTFIEEIVYKAHEDLN